MLRLGLKAHVEGPMARIRRLITNARNLQPLYKQWGRYLRQEAKERIDAGEGFAPLAESTRKRLQHTRTGAVTAQGKVRQSHAKRLEVQLKQQIRRDKLEESTLDDLKDLVRGGRQALSMALSDRRAKVLVRLQKQLQKAHEGKPMGGKERQSNNYHILGKLSNSLRAKGTQTEATLESRVPWSRIHNEGGTAGHGAHIPARPFLLITSESKRILAEMAARYLSGEDE